jgi:hypothetical protein
MKERICELAKENKEEELLSLLPGTIFYSDAIKEAAKHNHSELVNKLFFKLGLQLNDATAFFSNPQLASLNIAIEGYATGLHFEEIKKLVSQGANIYHALNALIREDSLNQENAQKLINCVVDEAQKEKLKSNIETVYGINLTSEPRSERNIKF